VQGDTELDLPGVVALAWDRELSSVVVTWRGHATAADFRRLLAAEVASLRNHDGSRLLADCRLQRRLDQDVQDEADQEWVEQALAAGLRHFAVVLPNDRDAAIDVMDRLGRIGRERIDVRFFQDPPAARRWLKSLDR
jgi:SpoIIAA-like